MPLDLAYLTSHGFAARMVMQTDLLGRLRDAGLSVAVIAPDVTDPVLAAYCEQRGIALHAFDERGRFSDENYMFKRKYFLEDIEAVPALMDKHVHAVRYNTSRNPLRRVRPFYYWGLYRLRQRFPGLGARFAAREQRYLRSDAAARLVDRLRPRALVATYPCNFNEAVLLHHGNQHPDVQTWIHLLSWDNITAKGRFPATADRYIAWGPIMRDELVEYYDADPADIAVCGVPHFDLHAEVRGKGLHKEALAALGLRPEAPYLFFGMSAPRFAPAEITIVEWLAAQVEAGTFGPDLQLVVRPHPQNVRGNLADLSWLGRLEQLNAYTRTAVDMPRLVKSRLSWSTERDDMVRLARLLSGAAVVLNSGSTISIDALMQDRPVVITAFDGDETMDYWRSARRLVDYTHLAKLVALGGLQVTRSFADLSAALREALAHPEARQAARAETVRQECFAADGQATQRVVDTLVTALGAGRPAGAPVPQDPTEAHASV